MPDSEGIRRPRSMSTTRQQYVCYLSTDALVRTLELIDEKLSTTLLTAERSTRTVYRAIREDVALELAGRQLGLWDEPAAAIDYGDESK